MGADSPTIRQLLAYSFPPGSSFEGELVGALERIESGGALRILDALFVSREGDSGELVAVALGADGAAGAIGRLLSFRLDGQSSRAQATERVLRGPRGPLARSLAGRLEPGAALAAVLVEHTWARQLDDAAGRIGGRPLASAFVEAQDIGSVWAELPADVAARGADQG